MVILVAETATPVTLTTVEAVVVILVMESATPVTLTTVEAEVVILVAETATLAPIIAETVMMMK